MVALEQLEALDLVIWLRTTERAATLALTNQSTISRRCRAALQAFGLALTRCNQGWRCDGDTVLLQMERLVHQQVRLHGRQPLRLQVPCWTRRMAQWTLPEGWCATPPDPALACEDPIGLLRDRVIDACLITSCQLPAQTDDLLLIELYRRPIELTLFGAAGGDLGAAALTLEPIRFLPGSCTRNAAALFEDLTGTAPPRRSWRLPVPANEMALGVSFLTPEMRMLQERPWRVDDALEPCLYVERLVLLAEHARQPSVQRLLNQLVPQFESLTT